MGGLVLLVLQTIQSTTINTGWGVHKTSSLYGKTYDVWQLLLYQSAKACQIAKICLYCRRKTNNSIGRWRRGISQRSSISIRATIEFTTMDFEEEAIYNGR